MIRCEGCRRHIFQGETACPFCAAPGRRLRTGLLAAGLVALTGCPSTSSPIYGAPAGELDAQIDAQVHDAALIDAAPVDAATTDAQSRDMSADAQATRDMASPADMARPDDMANPDDMSPADMADDMAGQADMARAPDMQVDMFIALPPYGIPPEPERDPE